MSRFSFWELRYNYWESYQNLCILHPTILHTNYVEYAATFY